VTGRDITDRKRAEEELKKYGVILANLRDIVYFVRLDGSIIEVNDAAVRAYGYSRDELLSMNVSDLRIPSERAVLPDFLKRCYENGCLFETVHQQRDGSTFPVEISSRGIELNGQKVLIGVGRDITKRRQAEDAIRTNAINLARAENLANLGHWDWDLTTNKVKWSDGHFRIFGYPVAHDTETYEMWQDRVHPDDIDGVEKMLREGMEKGTSYSCNFRTLLPDGSIRYLHAEADKPVMDESGRPVRWFGIVQDITERKRADEALKESEERFRTTFEQSAVGMTQVSLDGRFLLVNKKYCDITGYSEDELLGLTVADITYPADVVVESEKINRLLAGELDTFSSDKRYVRKDGSLIWVKLTVALVRDQGKPNYMTGVTEDITQRKRAEEELVEAKKHAELYVDLMGHDINNLNQVALGYLELAVEMVKDDEVRDIVKKPLDAIQNSSKLIENVRKLQRLKTGGLKIEAIDVGGLLVELRDQYLNMPGKDIVIDYSPLGDCYVMANGLLRDVFSNLIGNAIKHSGSSKSVLIGLGLERVGDDGREYCRVIVEDDGPGIPDVQKEKVFERFRKEDAKASGKGLGLYLVKSLVEDFHGTVHVEDRIKGDYTQGARFVVMLPAIEK
jgi:PAS domain S-box-containing protein